MTHLRLIGLKQFHIEYTCCLRLFLTANIALRHTCIIISIASVTCNFILIWMMLIEVSFPVCFSDGPTVLGIKLVFFLDFFMVLIVFFMVLIDSAGLHWV